MQTAVTMRQVTGSMTNVVRGMDQAMKAMDLEKVSMMLRWLVEIRLIIVLDFSGHGPI